MSGCSGNQQVAEASAEAPDPSSSTTPCPCQKQTSEVSESRSQTIVAPAAYSAWSGTYSWRSKFSLEVDSQNCTVKVTIKVKVTGTITAAQKSAWKSACEGKWNGKAKITSTGQTARTCCPNGYPVTAVLEYVTSGEHYTVRANAAGATEGGRSGQGGTTSMTGWGVADTVDITHEFGHMLGCCDEYFTTNGVNYSGFRDASGGVMNNPANNPLPRNYNFIASKVQGLIGGTCTAVAP